MFLKNGSNGLAIERRVANHNLFSQTLRDNPGYLRKTWCVLYSELIDPVLVGIDEREEVLWIDQSLPRISDDAILKKHDGNLANTCLSFIRSLDIYNDEVHRCFSNDRQ